MALTNIVCLMLAAPAASPERGRGVSRVMGWVQEFVDMRSFCVQ